jgi:hypothetical protein
MFRLLVIPLVLLIWQQASLATGLEEPTRWLGLGSKIILDPPEFFFEVETRRVAKDLHSEFKANVPPGIGSERSYRKQTDEADAADFDDAIRTGELQPPDPQKARDAHNAAIKALNRTSQDEQPTDGINSSESESPPLPSLGSSSTTPLVTPQPSAPAKTISNMPNEFASEFADYHRGALAYHAGDKATAQREWQALLNRPASERKYRTTWAEYMLGKMALEADQSDDARAHFHKLRNEVKAGAIDSLGLAVASIGWEAQMELKAQHFPEAARLYLEQRAAGDLVAVDSLHALMNELIKAAPDLTPAMSDALLQRLTTAAALCGIGAMEGFSETNEQQEGPSNWLRLLEKADAKQLKDADCVAWMEYQKGDYKAAERWLKLAESDSPYALWLKAKLTLREGNIDIAAKLLSRALPKLPPEKQLESRSMEFETMPGDVSKGDLGSLRVARADFVTAAKLFLNVRNCDDAVYLAEGVFTLPELKQFVKELPEKPKKENEDSEEDDRKTFQEIIGRRLMRAGKFTEARPYFAEEEQKALDEYVDLIKKGNDAHAAKQDRADALWKAAKLVADHEGHALFDYALPAAMAGRSAGREVKEAEVAFSAGKISLGEPIAFVPPVSEAEKKRLKSNITPALHRYHADYIAADLAWRAAQLMPDNDEQTAKVLNTAGSWLKNGDDKAADRFYQAIERRCAKTEIGQEAIKRHWFVDTPETQDDTNSAPEGQPTP